MFASEASLKETYWLNWLSLNWRIHSRVDGSGKVNSSSWRCWFYTDMEHRVQARFSHEKGEKKSTNQSPAYLNIASSACLWRFRWKRHRAQSCRLLRSPSSQSEKIMAMLYRALRSGAYMNSPRCLLGKYVDHAREWGKLCIKSREQVQWPAKFDDLWDKLLRCDFWMSWIHWLTSNTERWKSWAIVNEHLDRARSTDIEIFMRKISEIWDMGRTDLQTSMSGERGKCARMRDQLRHSSVFFDQIKRWALST